MRLSGFDQAEPRALLTAAADDRERALLHGACGHDLAGLVQHDPLAALLLEARPMRQQARHTSLGTVALCGCVYVYGRGV